jgi:hypothetical protein
MDVNGKRRAMLMMMASLRVDGIVEINTNVWHIHTYIPGTSARSGPGAAFFAA